MSRRDGHLSVSILHLGIVQMMNPFLESSQIKVAFSMIIVCNYKAKIDFYKIHPILAQDWLVSVVVFALMVATILLRLISLSTLFVVEDV